MNEASSLAIQFELRPAVRAISRRPREKAEEAPSPYRYARYPRIVQVMALAIHFREMLERGEAKDYADLARLGCVSRERISQIMMLNWLAPEIQKEVLQLPKTPGGRFPLSETTLRSVARSPRWEVQRAGWARDRPPTGCAYPALEDASGTSALTHRWAVTGTASACDSNSNP